MAVTSTSISAKCQRIFSMMERNSMRVECLWMEKTNTLSPSGARFHSRVWSLMLSQRPVAQELSRTWVSMVSPMMRSRPSRVISLSSRLQGQRLNLRYLIPSMLTRQMITMSISEETNGIVCRRLSSIVTSISTIRRATLPTARHAQSVTIHHTRRHRTWRISIRIIPSTRLRNIISTRCLCAMKTSKWAKTSSSISVWLP